MKWSDIFDKYNEHRFSHENEKTIRGYFLCTTLELELENIPNELIYEKCQYFDTTGKKYGNMRVERVHISDIAGTSYKEYAGGSWLDSFCLLHRIIYYIADNKLTYNKCFYHMKDSGKSNNVRLAKTKEGEYYVKDNGNHRVTIYKLLYFANMYHRNIRRYDVYNPKTFWLYAYVEDEA